MRNSAHKDTEHPAGCYVFPAEPLTEGSKRLVTDLSKRVTWARSLTGKETPEEAYARGWADAIKKYEDAQRKVSRETWWDKHPECLP